jgi:putative transposase
MANSVYEGGNGMPRCARIKSQTQVYHIMLRGNNREKIFADEEDKSRIIDTLGDEEAREIITTVCKVKNAVDLQKLDIVTRNTYLKDLKEEYSLSIRQIERLTGINSGIILKT